MVLIMFNALALRIMSGIMAVSIAAAPLSTDDDYVNPRYYGTYTNGLSSSILIEASLGCKFDKVRYGKIESFNYYVKTDYTRDYTISSKNFTAIYSKEQRASSLNGNYVEYKSGPYTYQGTEETRNDSTAPRRIYIHLDKGATFWKDTPWG